MADLWQFSERTFVCVQDVVKISEVFYVEQWIL